MINSPIDDIKSRLDIVEVVGSYIKLQKAGANWRAVCPFHSEKGPSFFVSPARQIWHCFGCGKGGDIFGFVKEIEGVEFGDALRILAQKAGVELKWSRPESASWRTERQRLYEISELATRFFEKQLEGGGKGKEVKDYLFSRGISEESIKKWRIGWSPEAWQGLSDFLISKKYTIDEIEKAGLLIKKEGGSHYDRFRARIMFPVFDINSQIIGFGGRVFQNDKETAKYINTPATILYDKSRVLYGLNSAKVDIRKKGFCVLMEGYTDVILAHQAGITNVVAASGTALTPYQLDILKRYSDSLYLCFDMDIGGDSATKRGINLAQLKGVDLKVLLLPEGKDPADIISKDPKEFEKIIASPVSIMDYYFRSAFSFIGPGGKLDKKTPEGKKAIAKVLLPVIKRIPNKIEQSFWVQKLAREIEAKEEDVKEELKKTKTEEETYGLEPAEVKNQPQKSSRDLMEEWLLILLFKKPENTSLFQNNEFLYFSKAGQEIFNKLKENPKSLPVSLLPEFLDIFNYLSLKSDTEEIEEKEIIPEIKLCLERIRLLKTKKELNHIHQGIKRAEEDKDSNKIDELSQEFDGLAKKIKED